MIARVYTVGTEWGRLPLEQKKPERSSFFERHDRVYNGLYAPWGGGYDSIELLGYISRECIRISVTKYGYLRIHSFSGMKIRMFANAFASVYVY